MAFLGWWQGSGGVGGRGGGEGSTARTDPEDRGGRGPPPEQQKCQGSVPSPLRSN